MKKMVVTLSIVLAASAMSACGDNKDAAVPAAESSLVASSPRRLVASSATPSQAVTSASPGPTSSPSKTSASPTKPQDPIYTDSGSGAVLNFNKGYPKIVSISKISPRVDVETYFEGEKKADALAPGVWTNLPDGAELQDAVADGPLIGLCASVEAFERKNPDISRGGTCW